MNVTSRLVSDAKYQLFRRKQHIVSNALLRWMYCLSTLLIAWVEIRLRNNLFLSLQALLRFERDVSKFCSVHLVPETLKKKTRRALKHHMQGGARELFEGFRKTEICQKYRRQFAAFDLSHRVRMRYPKKDDNIYRQGDLLLLKPYLGPAEKGVLFIQFDEGVAKFASLFDVVQVAKYYRFVIEPSTCGYQNPYFFLCYGLPNDVIIESQYLPDFQYIQSIGENLVASRLGAGDWVDPDFFSPGDGPVAKIYDLIMIANWLRWKRHTTLFRALRQLGGRSCRVAIVGYSIDGRTVDDVKAEAKYYGVEQHVDFFDSIPPQEVRDLIRAAKVGILLSEEEGANRSIYECFFCDVPVILTAHNQGVNRDHINNQTGWRVSDAELPTMIKRVLEGEFEQRPRNWALQHTGYIRSTALLNAQLKELALSRGEAWTRDIFTKCNFPYAMYISETEREQADTSISHLYQFLR